MLFLESSKPQKIVTNSVNIPTRNNAFKLYGELIQEGLRQLFVELLIKRRGSIVLEKKIE